MSWLALSILFSSLVVLIFKFFEKYRVVTFHGIIINYAVCCLTGILLLQERMGISDLIHAPWLYWSLLLGILFITVFNAIGWVAQKISVSVSMVAAKMSVVIPVVFAVFWLNEPLHIFKIGGIFLSLLALYFVVGKKNASAGSVKFSIFYPLLVFAGSGCIDTIIKFIQVTYLHQSSVESVLIVVFGAAFIAGVLGYLLQPAAGRKKITWKDCTGGLVLGVPNYFSMYFLFQALHQNTMGASTVFPVNNTGVVLLSTFLAFVLFHERLTPKGLIGVTLAVISILIMART